MNTTSLPQQRQIKQFTMVNANELKIGNKFIRELRTSRGLHYDQDFVLDEESMCKLFGLDTGLALQDLFPIPITPEILEKYGFRHRLGNIDTIHEYFIGTNPVTHDWLFDLCYIDSDGNRKFFYRNRHHVVTYLHQLQNLYFVLTGSDLTYNHEKQ